MYGRPGRDFNRRHILLILLGLLNWLIKKPIFAILLLILMTCKGEVPARSWRDTTSLPRLVVVASMAMRDGDGRTTLDMNKLAPENEQFGSKRDLGTKLLIGEW